jgi:hypothetical protein
MTIDDHIETVLRVAFPRNTKGDLEMTPVSVRGVLKILAALDLIKIDGEGIKNAPTLVEAPSVEKSED